MFLILLAKKAEGVFSRDAVDHEMNAGRAFASSIGAFQLLVQEQCPRECDDVGLVDDDEIICDAGGGQSECVDTTVAVN